MNKFCTSCGAVLEEGQRFCGNCWKPVQGSGTAVSQPSVRTSTPDNAAGASTPDNAGVANTPGNAGGASTPDSNRKIILVLLCVLVGEVGAHCFYAGKKKRGIMELSIWAVGLIWTVFLGLMGSMAFGFGYLFMPQGLLF